MPRDLAIARLANHQHAVVHHRQLRAIGLSSSAIGRWQQAGRLHRLYRGVYAVGHRVVPREGWYMAALLACGPGAVLSHESAAAHWRLLPPRGSVTDVTVSRGRGAVHADIRVHGVRRLEAMDWGRLARIPVTTVARTLLDLAEARPDRLKRALEAADREGRFNLLEIEAVIARNPGRRGIRPLRALLDDSVIEPATRSDVEALFLDLLHAAGFPKPLTNARVQGFEVDAYWPQQRLIVEIDGFKYHRTAAAFDRDRARDVRLQLAGHMVLRFSARQLLREPDAVVAAVELALRRAARAARAQVDEPAAPEQ